MADISINKFTSVVKLQGNSASVPSLPPSLEDTPPAVNPPGTGVNPSASTFLQLTDTPALYTGQGAKAVSVKSDETGLEFIDFPTVTGGDEPAVKTTASADQTLPSGVLTILDYDSTLTNNATLIYSVGTDGRITVSDNGVFDITAGVVIEANAVTALESAFLGIFRNGNLIAISSINTTIAAGASSGLSCSTQIALLSGDIIDCRALVTSVGGLAPGLARRLGTLLGANATQVNSLAIVKCISNGQSFLQLSDTPASYTGQAGLFPRVNSGETGLEFASAIGGTIASGQVAFGNGVNTVGGSSSFTFTTTNNVLSLGNSFIRGGGVVELFLANGTSGTNFISAQRSNLTLRINTNANAISFQSTANTAGSVFRSDQGYISSTALAFYGNLNDTSCLGIIRPQASGYFATNRHDLIGWEYVDVNNAGTNLWVTNNQVKLKAVTISSVGNFGINTTSPTNTLDVNGTARIRTLSNATGDFVTASATGVLQKRTAAEVVSDLGVISSKWTEDANGIYRNGRVVIGSSVTNSLYDLRVNGKTVIEGTTFEVLRVTRNTTNGSSQWSTLTFDANFSGSLSNGFGPVLSLSGNQRSEIFSTIAGVRRGSSSTGELRLNTFRSGVNYTGLILSENQGVFIGETNESTAVSIEASSLEVKNRIKTGSFTGTTSKFWRLGEKKTATVSLDTTQYITIEVDGVVYNLALVTI